uniref:UDP-glucose 4-epimerase n=1 Tax=Florenciella sp. virus SA2 TaxID=3240092 RepID=A0AB39J927_9VIRU
MSNKPIIIVTGGCGYIGSHTCIELANYFELVIIDNLKNSSQQSINKVEKLISQKIIFYKEDLLNIEALDIIFAKHNPYAVIHFAGLKSVNESIKMPLVYYQNNINSTLNLLEIMKKYKCFNLIFSSSATVYGNKISPLKEDMVIGEGITNPYGQTKYMIEKILEDICISSSHWNIISLRYFNPVGAHPSGLIGENPNDIPNNLMPFILKVAINNNTDINLGAQYNELKIFGGDYSTKDGSCERDFIHVTDLAKGHVAALQKIDKLVGYNIFNLGTGTPVSVLKIINEFETINKVTIPHKLSDRRPGDLEVSFCDPEYTEKILHWKTEKSLKDICVDAWRFQKLNPRGF